MKSYWWALIQYDYCSYKKNKLLRTQTDTEGWDSGKRWLPASQGERPQWKPTLTTSCSQVLASRTTRKWIFIKSSSLCHFVMLAPENEYTCYLNFSSLRWISFRSVSIRQHKNARQPKVSEVTALLFFRCFIYLNLFK